jgi:hypothetical protein
MKSSKQTRTAKPGLHIEWDEPDAIDPVEQWSLLLEETPEDQLISIVPVSHFLTHLPLMNVPSNMANRFIKEYGRPEKEHARSVAAFGLVETSHGEQWMLWDRARHFADAAGITCAWGDHKPSEKFINTLARIVALGFSEIVANKDVPALRRMISIIESQDMPKGIRGGPCSEEYDMLLNFSKLHLRDKSLPTKKQLREACGLNDLASKKLAEKRMKKLGLWGLPTEPEI